MKNILRSTTLEYGLMLESRLILHHLGNSRYHLVSPLEVKKERKNVILVNADATHIIYRENILQKTKIVRYQSITKISSRYR